MSEVRSRRPKFALVQAARGIAALWVVLFHMEKGENIDRLTPLWPDWITGAVFRYGSAGVAVFFVLSGFVIAHSLADKHMDGREFGRFVARRSIRLDPPYWASMLLMVTAGTALAVLRHVSAPPPEALTVLAHLFYLQELLHRPEIQIVYWTLTYEIQFYLVFAATRWMASRMRDAAAGERAIRAVTFYPLLVLALVSAVLSREWTPHGLFCNLWYGFFAGVLAYEAGYQRRRPIFLLVLSAILFVVQRDGVFNVPCAATALVLFLAGRTNWLERGLSGRPWQALGSISYSLYLIHVPTMLVAFAIWRRVIGRGPVQDLAGMTLVSILLLVAASLFWWLLERPSQKLATRIWRTGPDARNDTLQPLEPDGQ